MWDVAVAVLDDVDLRKFASNKEVCGSGEEEPDLVISFEDLLRDELHRLFPESSKVRLDSV